MIEDVKNTKYDRCVASHFSTVHPLVYAEMKKHNEIVDYLKWMAKEFEERHLKYLNKTGDYQYAFNESWSEVVYLMEGDGTAMFENQYSIFDLDKNNFIDSENIHF